MNVQDVRTPSRQRRNPRSDRAEARHRALLDAALEIIGREGIDAVSHRKVAELAGVPLGSTTYYFTSRDDMLVQALEHFARGEIAALDRTLGSVSAEHWAQEGAPGFVQRLVDLAEPQLGEGRWRGLAQYALFQEAARRPELRPIVQAWNEAWWEVLGTVLRSLGRPSTAVDAQMALALLDGLLLAGLAQGGDDYIEAVLRPALARWLGIA